MELSVVRTVLAGFEPTCAVGARGTCHRSGDEPPVLLLHVHIFINLSCSQTRVIGLACRSTRALVAHCSVDVSIKNEVGAHTVDSYNPYAIHFE